MRRLFCLFTVLVLVLLCCSSALALNPDTLCYGSRGEEVRELQKALIALGYLKGEADGIFGVEENATVGDMLAALYAGLGGAPNAPEEALAWLTQAGVLSGTEDLGAELHEDFLCNLLVAVGAQISTETPDAAVPRGDLADLFFQLFGQAE